MSSPTKVTVRYRGQTVCEDAETSELAAGMLVHTDTPMPVGTEVEVIDGDAQKRAVVGAVHERWKKVRDGDSFPQPGMVLRFD